MYLARRCISLQRRRRDLKALLSRLQYEDGLHADRLKTRLTELRVSSGRSQRAPDERLRVVMAEAMFSTGGVELLAALVKVFKHGPVERLPQLCEADERPCRITNRCVLMRHIIAEEEEGLRLLEAAYQDMVNSAEKEAQAQRWADTLAQMLRSAGGIAGDLETTQATIRPQRSEGVDFRVARKPARDDTFPPRMGHHSRRRR